MANTHATLRVAILEDQALFREMLQHLLRAFPGVQVVSAGGVRQALAEWDPSQIDVALLDFELPDGTGVDAGRALQAVNPKLGVVLLSAVDRVQVMLELSEHEQANWSYLSKNSSTSSASLIRAIRASAEGRSIIDSTIIARREPRVGTRISSLSPRQLDVLKLLAEGLTNQAIAEHFDLSINSVNNHVNAVYAGLGLSDAMLNPRVSAVRVYLEESV